MANFDPFDSDIRQRAGNLRRTPSPQAWNRIERRLDRRSRPHKLSVFGLRPWMIAAMLLLVAGLAAITTFSRTSNSPLAQRAESVEDINSAFNPAENFDAEAYRSWLEENAPTAAPSRLPEDFRDVTVAAKYRS